MKKAAILFSLAASLVLAVGAGGQVNNTFYVKSFQGADVGTMVSAAMVQCNPDTTVKCFLVIDPSLVDYAAGTLPSMCAQCYLIDYRYGLPWGGGSGLPTGCSGSTGTIDCTGLIEGGTLEASSLTNTNTGVVIVSQTLGSGYLTASYSLSGGTCPTPPTLGQLVAAGLVINVITNPGSCSVLPSVIISGSGGTGATVTLGFAPNVATLSAAGLLQSDQMTGMGSVVMANGPALSHPLLNAPIVNFMTGQTYSELTSECSGGISPWMLNSWNSNGITESVSLAVCGSSAVNAIGFRASQFSGWQNFDSVHIGNNAQDGSADTSTLQVNFFNTFVPGQNSLSFHPCYSSTACLPQTSGLNWWVSNAGGALGIPVSSVGGGTGYTAAGTCALSGGALSSGSADGCTVSLSSGALIAAITGTGVYTVPPVLTLSGASGGSGANLTGTLVIQNPASATANLRVDPAGTLHYGPGSVQSPRRRWLDGDCGRRSHCDELHRLRPDEALPHRHTWIHDGICFVYFDSIGLSKSAPGGDGDKHLFRARRNSDSTQWRHRRAL
jgi:hypothetical protein